jgi:hypothetical protein
MSEAEGALPAALVLRLSVPASGGLREIATELAGKVAEYVGIGGEEAGAIGRAIDGLVGRVAPHGAEADVAFEFRQRDGELLIGATCEGQRSELRYPLPE